MIRNVPLLKTTLVAAALVAVVTPAWPDPVAEF